MACDSNCCVDRRSGIFDHRLGEICFALGGANRLAGCFATIQSTFKSEAGTVPVSNPYSYAYPKGNTRRYPDCDAVSKSSADASASPT